MFDRFTDRARKVLGLSRQEALRLNHDYIGTEHILLGLVLEGSAVAADVLKNLAVDPKRIQQGVERLVTRGKAPPTMGALPFTTRAKTVLELALEEASNLDHNCIGTEHLLLGLIREEEGIAAQVLRDLNVLLEDVREEVLQLLGAWTGEEAREATDDPGPLTSRARRVMALAERHARRLHHDRVRPEHILLGMVEEAETEDELPSILLRRLARETKKLLTPGTEPVAESLLSLTPAAKAILEGAFEVAGEHGSGQVTVTHLLLGLLREKKGIAARLLGMAGITAEDVSPQARPWARPSRVGFDRFTDHSRKALGYARQAAQRLGHDYIGTEHVLLGLVASGDAEVVRRLGVDPERVRAEVARHVTRGNTTDATGQLPFTPAMKRALELTLEEMQFLGHSSIREEHLLLGLIREEKGAAAQVLAALGVTLDAVRNAFGPPGPPG